jgi:SAM-dependent methyltransferase
MTDPEIVRDFYENYDEWGRFDRHSAEFEINKRYIHKYIKSGDTVLDIGGGPGRYALDLAARGCAVTLLDLAPKHIAIAGEKSAELGLSITTVCGDACCADKLVDGQFDAVLLMGPLYHLPDEKDRVRAVDAALKLLKPHGVLFAAFISSYAGTWDFMARHPDYILTPDLPPIFDVVLQDSSFSGTGLKFTSNHFIRPKDVEPFMARFPLKKLHLLNSESVLLLREKDLAAQPPEVFSAWLDFAEKLCEREEFLSMAGHFLYIGEKT